MKMLRLTCAVLAIGCSTSGASAECGIASNYSSGKVTANGERYDPRGVSAAHKKLPFGTKVAVVNRRTGKSIVVRINDRGPFVKGRIIDLSKAAARSLGSGDLAPVCIRVLSFGGETARLREASIHGRLGLLARLKGAED